MIEQQGITSDGTSGDTSISFYVKYSNTPTLVATCLYTDPYSVNCAIKSINTESAIVHSRAVGSNWESDNNKPRYWTVTGY